MGRDSGLDPFLGMAKRPLNALVYKRNKFMSNKWKRHLPTERRKDYVPKISIEVEY